MINPIAKSFFLAVTPSISPVLRIDDKSEKANQEGIKSGLSDSPPNREISDIEKLLYRFPEIVERAGEEYEPHYIATYLFELAQAFNSYYGNNKIADKTDENAPYKVALTEAVAQIIKNGLNLLGIESPERL